MVEEIKRWIAERRLAPGDKLPKEDELQELFGVSKGTAREALKSLEVQGLVTVTTGPAGGATIGEVPLERALQLLQNYLFFRELDVAQIYAVRRLLEPELAAGAVPHLTEEHFAALERSIETCAPASGERRAGAGAAPGGPALPRRAGGGQSQHAAALHVPGHQPPAALLGGDGRSRTHAAGHKLGETNVAAHRRLLAAARRGDAEQVRKLMVEHIDEAERHVHQVAAAVRRRFVLESDLQRAHRPSEAFQRRRRPEMTETHHQPPAAVIGTGAAVMTTAAMDARRRRTATWRPASPRWRSDGRVFGLHALLVWKGGTHGVRALWNGRGRDLGTASSARCASVRTVLHDLRSVSKSIVGMLYGIALADGKVPPPEARLYDQFPQYADLAKQPGRERLTVAARAQHDGGRRVGRAHHPVSRSAQQRDRDGGCRPIAIATCSSCPIVGPARREVDL